MERRGRKEYIQVLRLLENFSMTQVEHAIQQAFGLGTIGFDAIKHLILCAIERRPAKLDLTLYPYPKLCIACNFSWAGIQADRGSGKKLEKNTRRRQDQAVVEGHCLQGWRTGAGQSTGSAETPRLTHPATDRPPLRLLFY
jgi:hypothetical protein